MLSCLKLFALVSALIALALTGAVDAKQPRFDMRSAFATKTSYDAQLAPPSSISSEYTLLQTQYVIRHGTRFPTSSNAVEIANFIARLQTEFREYVPAWIMNYSLPYNLTVEGQLASAGADELYGIGKRARKHATRLPAAFSADKYVLQHTYKSRTKDSAKAFASAFFSNPQDVTYTEYTKKKDPLLRFYDECPRYTRDVKENPATLAQLDIFKKSNIMLQNIESLKKALDLPADAEITSADVESAYSACSFDIALYDDENHWCKLLAEDLIRSVEYAEDMEAFYEESAGNKINYEIASVLLKDIVDNMASFINGQSAVVGNFRFAHGETTLPLMTLLGYADSTPLLGNVTMKDIKNHKFRTSELAKFAANVEFRLLKKKSNGKYFVQILVNEKVGKIPGCNATYCELGKVLMAWSYHLGDYDQAADCKI